MAKEKGNKLFHKLDRYIGIPLVFLLGKSRKNRNLPQVINKIAVLNLFSIGDNVLMSGVIADIRSQYPLSKITFFTGSSNYDLVKLIPEVDEIVKLPVADPLKVIRFLKKTEEFDILMDFCTWPRINAIYSFFFKAKYTIGFKTELQYKHYVYDAVVNHSHKIHEIDNYRNLVNVLYKGQNHPPKLIVEKFDLSKYEINPNHKIGIFHPWSAGLRKQEKQWDNENWSKLFGGIYKQFDTILITGAPSDYLDSETLLQKIKKDNNSSKIINIAGKLSLSKTAYLISISDFVFSVDTGIAHITAALNKPQICLQGPANSNRWRPYSDNTILINPSKGSYGYISLGFEKSPDNTNCMENISPDDVINKFKEYQNKTMIKK